MHAFRFLIAALLIATAGSSQVPVPPKISWETSFDAARVRAERERKPILLLHLLGRLDEEMC